MNHITLTPAYGRDYKNIKAILDDWDSGKDFLIAQFGHPYDGKPANKSDLTEHSVSVRYSKLRKVTLIQD
jgi:hypothetical protein